MRKLAVSIKYLENFTGDVSYADLGSSGLDLPAGLDAPLTLNPGDMVTLPLGVAFEIPSGYEGQLRARSGMARKGIGVVNGVGTIDSSYRGEVCAILINYSREPYTISPGDRVAQIVFSEVLRAQLTAKEALSPTSRRGGFGSTGK